MARKKATATTDGTGASTITSQLREIPHLADHSMLAVLLCVGFAGVLSSKQDTCFTIGQLSEATKSSTVYKMPSERS